MVAFCPTRSSCKKVLGFLGYRRTSTRPDYVDWNLPSSDGLLCSIGLKAARSDREHDRYSVGLHTEPPALALGEGRRDHPKNSTEPPPAPLCQPWLLGHFSFLTLGDIAEAFEQTCAPVAVGWFAIEQRDRLWLLQAVGASYGKSNG